MRLLHIPKQIPRGFFASSRRLDAHYTDSLSLDTLPQVVHARLLTEQTIAALERQLHNEHVKLRVLQNVEVSLMPTMPPPPAGSMVGSPSAPAPAPRELGGGSVRTDFEWT